MTRAHRFLLPLLATLTLILTAPALAADTSINGLIGYELETRWADASQEGFEPTSLDEFTEIDIYAKDVDYNVEGGDSYSAFLMIGVRDGIIAMNLLFFDDPSQDDIDALWLNATVLHIDAEILVEEYFENGDRMVLKDDNDHYLHWDAVVDTNATLTYCLADEYAIIRAMDESAATDSEPARPSSSSDITGYDIFDLGDDAPSARGWETLDVDDERYEIWHQDWALSLDGDRRDARMALAIMADGTIGSVALMMCVDPFTGDSLDDGDPEDTIWALRTMLLEMYGRDLLTLDSLTKVDDDPGDYDEGVLFEDSEGNRAQLTRKGDEVAVDWQTAEYAREIALE